MYGPLLVLLTLQHHSVQSTNTFANYVQMFAPILMVQLAKLHQYIDALTWKHQYTGGTVPVSPVGEETLTFCEF
jgi:hypothetical protein